jgi:predicted Zn-dependent protease
LLGRLFSQAGVSRGEDVEINGLKGYSALARSVTTSFGPGPARVVVLYFNNLAYVFAGVSKASSGAPNADPVMLSSIKTFRRMKESEFPLGEPHKIMLVRTQPGTTVEELAKTAAIEKSPVDMLRLLNDLYPDKQPQPGQLIKSVKD